MINASILKTKNSQQCQWSFNIENYDCKRLTDQEFEALAYEFSKRQILYSNPLLARLMQPLDEAFEFIENSGAYPYLYENPRRPILQQVLETKTLYWEWTAKDWVNSVLKASNTLKSRVVAAGYLFAENPDFLVELHAQVKNLHFQKIASVIFPPSEIEMSARTIQEVLESLGYSNKDEINIFILPNIVFTLLLHSKRSRLEEITDEKFSHLFELFSKRVSETKRLALSRISFALCHLGILQKSYDLRLREGDGKFKNGIEAGVAQEWFDWVECWQNKATLSPSTIKGTRLDLHKIGRWLAQEHSGVTCPAQWDRKLAAEFIAAVNGWKVGDFTVNDWVAKKKRQGLNLNAATKEALLVSLKKFLKDLQEWELIPVRLNPTQALKSPRSVRALVGPKPHQRLIESAVWLKLLWAGLNLTEEDMAISGNGGSRYPIELVKAVAIAWLFVGSRNDEYRRLRVGCTRFISSISEHEAEDVPRPQGPPFPQNVCTVINIPDNKTSRSFTKCVDVIVGAVFQDWEKLRPKQRKIKDRKTDEYFDALFSYRGNVISDRYISDALIPTLCRKAGIPTEDKNGRITSHRGRTTIITELGKYGMTAFELAQFAGHKGLDQIRHYLVVTPTQLAQSYQKAGILQKNLRQIKVLIDKDAVESGAVANGEPWIYYFLGHGHCMNDFWSSCQHRMACAKCGFYKPLEPMERWLETKTNILEFLQEVPLDDEEIAALEGDIVAIDALMLKNYDIPTLDGQTPRQIQQAE